VQELATAHDGRVLAESEGVERGATFSVWLRLAEPLKDDQPAPPEAGNPLTDLRVVLVDDSVDLLTSFGALLSLEGAKVDTFDNAEAALKRLLEGDVDLLISDLGMPGMDGYQLISEVRRQPALAALPAIALTGYGRTRDPGHAVRSGFNAHTTKPATVEELKNIVSLLKSL
jgi:two-component system CheB/CheR fusion protein